MSKGMDRKKDEKSRPRRGRKEGRREGEEVRIGESTGTAGGHRGRARGALGLSGAARRARHGAARACTRRSTVRRAVVVDMETTGT